MTGREHSEAGANHGRALVTWHDVNMLAWLLFLLPLSWLAPTRLWTRLSVLIATVAMRLAPRRTAHRVESVRRTCAGHHGLPAPHTIVTSVSAGRVEQHLQYLREFRPGGWNPRIELTGTEHVDRALERGKGCIVWVVPMLYAPLVTKKGLHAAGYSVAHLSHEAHGLSQSRQGRWLNPLRIIPEERYVAERLVMSDGSELKHTRDLYVRLGANSLVSISASEKLGARVVTGPFFNDMMRLATGAPSLALASGAALLPVFVLKRMHDHFEVVIEPGLTSPPSSDRHQAVDEMVHRFMERIERCVVKYPDLYAEWQSSTHVTAPPDRGQRDD